MSIIVITPATELPVSIEMLKINARIDEDITEHDNLLMMLQESAVEYFQRHTSRQLMLATFAKVLSGFQCEVNLAPCPVLEVEHIKYFDEDNQEQTLSTNDYKVDKYTTPAVVHFNNMPLTADRADAVHIQFKAGNESADNVQADIKVAIMAYVTSRYDVPGNHVLQLPTFFSNLVKSYKLWIR